MIDRAPRKRKVLHYAPDGKDLFGDWLSGLKDMSGRAAILKRVSRAEDGNLGDRRAGQGYPPSPGTVGAVPEAEMKRAIPHRDYLMKHLAAPEEAAAYLDSVAEDGDIGFLLKALRQVVEAQGGVGALAKKTRLSRTSLYKTLSSAGNPEMGTLDAILAVYGIRLGFFPAKPASGARRSAWHAAHGGARHPGPMLGL